jgi:outer membrane protein OmpA-like peptidoglycan-associated protein
MTNTAHYGRRHFIPTGLLLALVLSACVAGQADKACACSPTRFRGAEGISVPQGDSEPAWWIDPVVSPPTPDHNGATSVIEAKIPADTLYDVGSAEVGPTATHSLDTVREGLDGAQITGIALDCHADASGNHTANQQLSEQRAANLASWIADTWNVKEGTIEARGHGDTQPIASNESPTGRALNRRCDIAITTPQPQ